MLLLRRSLLLFVVLVCALTASAQDVATLWISMPEELSPYLSLNQRKEMIECFRIGVDTSVVNALHGTTDIDTLTADYGRFILSPPRTLQLIRLPQDGDSILCVIDSYSAPATQSTIAFYDLLWQPLPPAERMPDIDVAELTLRPDTMTVADYEALCAWADPTLVEMNYNIETKELELSLSIPFVDVEDKEKISAIICKRRLMWGGKAFVKCY